MLGFTKKQKQSDTTNSVNADEVIGSDNGEQSEELIETELSLSPNWNIPNEDRYVYAFHNNESPKLKVNQISLYGIELNKLKNNSLVATALVKNTIGKSIHFEKASILLLGANKEIIARKVFDLKQIGTIPTNSARPWKFAFLPEDLVADTDFDMNTWSLAFEVRKKHQLSLEDSWEKSIAEETKNNLQKVVASAAPLKSGEINFMGLEAKQNENGDLVVTILIRNGSNKSITLEKVPLGVKDASNDEIAKGGFKLDDFVVKENTSKPWSFVFPSAVITKDEIDLSKWQVYVIKS
ncbi:accessory Sec system S-layer assembly protein [Virgibacillus necropolis]|uniref:accessory Sec system S-layer assembly protein n=1 Tax=Virgibacillus necropolis TaxID=163877 RepID=UPI003850DAAD